MSGYLLEVRMIAPLPDTRERMLAWMHGRALTPGQLRFTMSEAHRGLVDDVADAVRERFDAYSGEGSERSWRWFLAVYARFHAGSVPWRLSFASWPILPILDQHLLETMLTIPLDYMANRRVQDALLVERFPALARLPLDRNSDDVSPLAPSLAHRVGATLRRSLLSRTARGDEPVRRYYARMYDFENDGWRAIRRGAEPGREAMMEWFDRDALAAIVPPPDRRASHADPIAGGFAPKLLTGFMRWHAAGTGREG